MNGAEYIAGATVPGAASDILLLCDHASNAVPADIDLGIAEHLLGLHIAWDIGAGAVTRALSVTLGAPALLGPVSRLVIDLHREPEHPGLIPLESDGHAIPGNAHADRAARIARFHVPYHAAIAQQISARPPALIVSVHSFTPCLEQGGALRPWEVGILYNRDDRAARIAIDWLRGEGIVTGDNEPYSGKLLNATLNRHAESHAIPYLAIEIRNDAIADAAGVALWTERLARLSRHVRARLD